MITKCYILSVFIFVFLDFFRIPKITYIDRHYKITLLYLLKSHMLLSRAVKPENYFFINI